MTGPSCAAITRFVTPTWTSTTFLEGDLAVVGTVKLRCSFACHQGDVLSSLVNRISNPGPQRCGKSCATPGVRNRALVVLRIWTTIGDHLRGYDVKTSLGAGNAGGSDLGRGSISGDPCASNPAKHGRVQDASKRL